MFLKVILLLLIWEFSETMYTVTNSTEWNYLLGLFCSFLCLCLFLCCPESRATQNLPFDTKHFGT